MKKVFGIIVCFFMAMNVMGQDAYFLVSGGIGADLTEKHSHKSQLVGEGVFGLLTGNDTNIGIRFGLSSEFKKDYSCILTNYGIEVGKSFVKSKDGRLDLRLNVGLSYGLLSYDGGHNDYLTPMFSFRFVAHATEHVSLLIEPYFAYNWEVGKKEYYNYRGFHYRPNNDMTMLGVTFGFMFND